MAKAVNTLAALSQQLRTGSVSSRELTEDSLLQIARLNPALNAVITSCEDRALAAAAQADKALASGDVSPYTTVQRDGGQQTRDRRDDQSRQVQYGRVRNGLLQ